MASEAPTVQLCRACGVEAPPDAHFCPKCNTILSLARRPDYFEFLGLPRRLLIDSTQLEQRFRALSRQFHPDFFHTRPAPERLASLERASYLNDAYRTLSRPMERLEYVLALETGNGKPKSDAVPPALLEEVFELNEELDAVRDLKTEGAPGDGWRTRLETLRKLIDGKRERHEHDLATLSAQWDALVERGASADERRVVSAEIQERLLERNYIRNLLDTIERELE